MKEGTVPFPPTAHALSDDEVLHVRGVIALGGAKAAGVEPP